MSLPAGRTAELRGVVAPTFVLHGDQDRMVHPSGGAATAQAIPGARLVTIDGMGHHLAAGVVPHIVAQINDHLTGPTPHETSLQVVDGGAP